MLTSPLPGGGCRGREQAGATNEPERDDGALGQGYAKRYIGEIFIINLPVHEMCAATSQYYSNSSKYCLMRWHFCLFFQCVFWLNLT